MAKPPQSISPLPYPLTRRARLIIMFTLISLFFITTPLLLLYARGFTFDFGSGRLVHGGALSIETEPNEVTLWLNNIKINAPAPFRLSHLLPGNYHVKIARPGFYAWERDITILRNQTTYLHDIDLFEIQKPRALLSNQPPIERLVASPTSDSLVIQSKENETYTLSVFQANTEKPKRLTRVISTSPPIINWSPTGEFLKVDSSVKSDTNLLLINPEKPASIQTITFRPDMVFSFQWEEGASAEGLLVQNGKEIRRMNLQTTQSLFTLMNTSSLWFVDAEKTLWEWQQNSLNRYRGQKEIFSGTTIKIFSKIIHANENRIIGIDTNKLVVVHLNNETVTHEEEIPATAFYFYRDQNYHLAWFHGELYSITKEGYVSLINRFSSDIQDVQPLTPSGTLLILTDNKFITLHPQYFRTHELVSAEKIEEFGVNQKRREVYFLGTVEGVRGVWKLQY